MRRFTRFHVIGLAAATAFFTLAYAGVGRGHIHVPATPSVPFDLYVESSRGAAVGGYVLVEIPATAIEFARTRGYWTGSPIWIKRLAAGAGAHVCALDGLLFIDGRLVGPIHAVDTDGRPMPVLRLCRRLLESEIFVLGDHDRSFDSRYFGPLDVSAVRSALTPLFASLFASVRWGEMPAKLPDSNPEARWSSGAAASLRVGAARG